jgi:probable HAF family extracellular repeat protein
VPSDINNRGEVVGAIFLPNPNDQYHAFIYRNGVVTDLNSLPDVRAARWGLAYAMKINDRGQIAGFGYRDLTGLRRIFILTPHEETVACQQ